MINTIIVTAPQLSDLRALRLLYAPTAEKRPTGMTVVPIRSWIASVRQSDIGLNCVPYRQCEIAQLGLTQDMNWPLFGADTWA